MSRGRSASGDGRPNPHALPLDGTVVEVPPEVQMKSLAAPTSQKEKPRHFGEAFPPGSTHPEFNQPLRDRGVTDPCPAGLAGRVSGPDGSDPAAVVPASGRRPVAGLASAPESGFAGRDSGSDWTSRSPFFKVAQRQPWNPHLVAWKRWFPAGFFRLGRTAVPALASHRGGKTISVQALEAPSGAVAASGSRC